MSIPEGSEPTFQFFVRKNSKFHRQLWTSKFKRNRVYYLENTILHSLRRALWVWVILNVSRAQILGWRRLRTQFSKPSSFSNWKLKPKMDRNPRRHRLGQKKTSETEINRVIFKPLALRLRKVSVSMSQSLQLLKWSLGCATLT